MHIEKAILLKASLLVFLMAGNGYKNAFMLAYYGSHPLSLLNETAGQAIKKQGTNDNAVKIVGKGFYSELDGATVSFDVKATQNKQRGVSGQISFKSSFLEFRGNVDCLHLVQGKLIVSGTMRHISKGSLDWVFVGIRFQFTFEDNGENNGPPADRMSSISIGGPTDCVSAINLATPNEIKGNIQISY